MIKVENSSVYGFEAAIRGMRNPLNSWKRSDSCECNFEMTDYCNECGKLDQNDTGICLSYSSFYCIGKNDFDLMKRLFKSGSEHRKYLRMIHVTLDITAPLYWWKEFDTYKVGTVANSCSTMHKIAAKEFTIDDFSTEHLNMNDAVVLNVIDSTLDVLNIYREKYLADKKKENWWQMIQLLPTSYNQRRTVAMNYETVFTIIRQRTGHKLDEWRELVEFLKTLPYVSQIGDFNEQSTAPSGEKE